MSLLSAEAGIATLAYLLAHAVCLDAAPWRARVRALLPSLAVVAGWRLLSVTLRVGVRGMGLYADPGAEPLRYVAAVAARAPLFLFGQWSLVPVEISFLLTAPAYRVFWGWALAELVLLAACLWPLLRRDAMARYLAAGMLLSLLPVCAAFPDNRLLVFAGLGAGGLLAQFLSFSIGRASPLARGLWERAVVRPVAFTLAGLHLGVAPLLLPLQAAGWGRSYAPMYGPVTLDAAVSGQSLVMVNGPLVFLACDLPLVQALAGRHVPRHTRVLSPSLAAVRIVRPDARTLILTPRHGYLARPVDTLFRARECPFHPGERLAFPDVTIEVTKLTPEGQPASIACHFPAPLEDPALRWLWWSKGRYRPFRPPPIGGAVHLPPAFPG
jgi:hypothetical protein